MDLYNKHRKLALQYNRVLELGKCDCDEFSQCSFCKGSFIEEVVPDDLSVDRLTSPLDELNSLLAASTSADLATWRMDRLQRLAESCSIPWRKLRKPDLLARLQHELYDESSSTLTRLRARHNAICQRRASVAKARVDFLRSLIARAREDLATAEQQAAELEV